MVEIHTLYQGELRCAATHMPSGAVLITDAPLDNHGKGESFSPTDLVAAALGSCMLTVMGIAAHQLALDLTGMRVTVKKEMMAKPTRRIGKLTAVITVPVKVEEAMQQKLMQAALTCPVHESLHPEVQQPIEFHWA